MKAEREPIGAGEVWLRFMILLPVAIFVAAWASLAFGGEVSRWHFVVGWLLTTGVLLVQVPGRRLLVLATSAGCAVLAAVLVAYSLELFDLYYDSQAYHLPAVVALRDGWNPIHQGHPCGGAIPILDLPNCDLLHGYPKSAWIVSAATYALVGDFEAGKFLNFWSLIALYLCAHLLFSRFREISRARRVLFSLAIAANPVALSELGSGYVDALLASYLGLFVLLLLDHLLFATPGRALLCAASLVFLVNLKFTGLVFGVVFGVGLAAIGVALNRVDRVRGLAVALVAALALGVSVLGYNPYVSNTREYGNPFFPAIDLNRGSSVVDNQVSAEFLELNRVEKFFVSLFSVSQGQDFRRPEFQVPFTSLRATPLMGDRFGGFGPLFSGCLVLACVLLPFLRSRWAWCGLGLVTASVFALATGWWARLTPQGWWLPLIVAIPIAAAARRSVLRHAADLLLLLLVLNSSVKLWSVARHQWRTTEKNAATLETMAAVQRESGLVVARDGSMGPRARSFYFTSKRRIADRGIPFSEVSESVCPQPLVLTGLEACPAASGDKAN